MNIAYITAEGRGLIDDCLVDAVDMLSGLGFRLSGMVRAAPVQAAHHPCAMVLRVLPTGGLFPISQALGPGARGCRLDGGSLESLALEVEAAIPGSDLLILNKFGKLEVQGRGLCPAFLQALDLGIPILNGVSALNLDDFQAFTQGHAEQIDRSPDAVLDWVSRMPLSLHGPSAQTNSIAA